MSITAIHDISGAEARSEALDEAVRVLRPGGRSALVDIRRTRDDQKVLVARGVPGCTGGASGGGPGTAAPGPAPAW